MQPEYVNERLTSLQEIDERVCNLLQEVSQIEYTLSELKRGNESVRPQLQQHAKGFYNDLETISSRMHREIELLDENTGTNLLPISVSKKALGQDAEKLHEQLQLLQKVLEK